MNMLILLNLRPKRPEIVKAIALVRTPFRQ